MATKPILMSEKDKDKPGVERVETVVPGGGVFVQYFGIEYVDDLTGKPGENTRTVRMTLPYEDEKEVVATGDNGEPLKNGDGSDKLTMEKFIGYEDLEVDLSDPSFAKLLAAVEPFRKAARPAPTPALAPVRTRTGSGASLELTAWRQRAREWAKTVFNDVGEKGQLKREYQDAYARANPDDKRPTA